MNLKSYGFTHSYHDAHLAKIELPNEWLLKINEWVNQPKKILLFTGNPGIGKTYFCAAFCNFLLEKNFMDFRYFSERELFRLLRSTIQNDWDYETEIQRLCEAHFLILDDLGSSQMTDWQKEVLFSLLDHRLGDEKPTIITTNLSISAMKEVFDPRFMSRIQHKENTILEINWRDKRKA